MVYKYYTEILKIKMAKDTLRIKKISGKSVTIK